MLSQIKKEDKDLSTYQKCSEINISGSPEHQLVSLRGLENSPNLGFLSVQKFPLLEIHFELKTKLLSLSQLVIKQCAKVDRLDFGELPNLFALDCSNNSLVYLNIKQLSKLTHLDCSNNQLSNMDLSNAQNLVLLNLNGNKIEEIPALGNPQMLKELRLHNNSIQKRANLYQLQPFTGLKLLTLYGNKVTDINGTMSTLASSLPETIETVMVEENKNAVEEIAQKMGKTLVKMKRKTVQNTQDVMQQGLGVMKSFGKAAFEKVLNPKGISNENNAELENHVEELDKELEAVKEDNLEYSQQVQKLQLELQESQNKIAQYDLEVKKLNEKLADMQMQSMLSDQSELSAMKAQNQQLVKKNQALEVQISQLSELNQRSKQEGEQLKQDLNEQKTKMEQEYQQKKMQMEKEMEEVKQSHSLIHEEHSNQLSQIESTYKQKLGTQYEQMSSQHEQQLQKQQDELIAKHQSEVLQLQQEIQLQSEQNNLFQQQMMELMNQHQQELNAEKAKRADEQNVMSKMFELLTKMQEAIKGKAGEGYQAALKEIQEGWKKMW